MKLLLFLAFVLGCSQIDSKKVTAVDKIDGIHNQITSKDDIEKIFGKEGQIRKKYLSWSLSENEIEDTFVYLKSNKVIKVLHYISREEVDKIFLSQMQLDEK